MSFKSLKNNKADSGALKNKILESEQGGGNRDPRMWRHSYNKDSKVGESTIRFLPRYDETGTPTVPWVSWTEYNFKGKGGYYHERSLVSIGEADPVSELNKAHWASIPESERKKGTEAIEARQRNVSNRYVANIVVLDDPKHPDNNGKVFLYEFGNGIKQILESAWFPEFQTQKPLVFFDWDEGADFYVRTKEKNSWVNYESSTFAQPSAVANGRIEIQEKLYNDMYDLSEFEAKTNYKTYDELTALLRKTLGGQYIARILGETYTPEQASANGENPFNVQKSQESNAEKNDPFANVNKEDKPDNKPVQNDPFANVGSSSNPEPKVEQKQEQKDPFANVNKEEPKTEQQDPFAGTKTDKADPFASLSLN